MQIKIGIHPPFLHILFMIQRDMESWSLMPTEKLKALKKNPAATAGFKAMSISCQREYKVWISTAKQDETIQRRLHETLRALAAGKKWAQRKDA